MHFILQNTVTSDLGKGTRIPGVMLSLDLQEESCPRVLGTGISAASPSWGEQTREELRQVNLLLHPEAGRFGLQEPAVPPQIPKPNPVPSALLPEKLHDLMKKKVFEAAFPLHKVRPSTQCLGGKSRRDGGAG